MKAKPCIDPEAARTLSEFGGRVFLNTIMGGGAYRYLELTSRQIPVLSIDVRSPEKPTAELLWKGEKKSYAGGTIEGFLDVIGSKDLYINHLALSNPIYEWAGRLKRLSERRRLHLLLHDFFPVCPSVNLLDNNGSYCGIPDESACDDCIGRMADSDRAGYYSRYFASRYPELREEGIGRWRALWREIVSLTDSVVFPSESARMLFLKAFPDTPLEKCIVAPHQTGTIEWTPPSRKRDPLPILDAGLIGEIADHKGARILDGLLSIVRDRRLPIRFRVNGTFQYAAIHEDNPHLVVEGRFPPEKLAERLSAHPIDLFLFPSIWPETFSYVTHEMMSTGLPIIATRLGAQGEALSTYPSAVLLEDSRTETYLAVLERLYNEKCLSMDSQMNVEVQPSRSSASHAEASYLMQCRTIGMAMIENDRMAAQLEALNQKIKRLTERVKRMERHERWNPAIMAQKALTRLGILFNRKSKDDA